MEILQCLRIDLHFLNWVRLVVFVFLQGVVGHRDTESQRGVMRVNGSKDVMSGG